jgi:hypothetical protein
MSRPSLRESSRSLRMGEELGLTMATTLELTMKLPKPIFNNCWCFMKPILGLQMTRQPGRKTDIGETFFVPRGRYSRF